MTRMMKLRAAVLLALPVAASDAHHAGPAGPETFRDPAVAASHDGVLALTLAAGRATVDIAGRPVDGDAVFGVWHLVCQPFC